MTLIDTLVASVLVLIMFGIGVSLTFKDITVIFAKPKSLVISLISQLFFLPLIAFAICLIFNIPIYVKIGLIILAASPGGTTSGFITYLFKGNTALSIVLTTTNSILTLFTIPLIVNFALIYFVGTKAEFQLPFFETIKEIFVLTAIPALVGISVRAWNEKIAELISKYAKPVLIMLLGIVFFLKFFGRHANAGISEAELWEILPYALLLNIACFATGFFLSKKFNFGFKNQITISVESAVHNTTMAFLISGTLLHNEQYGKVSLVYAMFSFWTALIFSYIIVRLYKTKEK
ncbi:MAG: bile acid:sodium symporter [Bacteroidota bacterium]